MKLKQAVKVDKVPQEIIEKAVESANSVLEFPNLGVSGQFETVTKPVFFVPGLHKGDVAFFESVYRKEPYSGSCKESMINYVLASEFDQQAVKNYILYLTDMFMDNLYTNSNTVLNNGVYSLMLTESEEDNKETYQFFKDNCPFDKYKSDGTAISFAVFQKLNDMYANVDEIRSDMNIFRSHVSEVVALCSKYATGWIYYFINNVAMRHADKIGYRYSEFISSAFALANTDIAKISEISEISFISSVSETLELNANAMKYNSNKIVTDQK